jgi:hypothetical protein
VRAALDCSPVPHLWRGAGLVLAQSGCAPRRILCVVGDIFLGGIARIISALRVGLPDTLFQVLGMTELVMPLILYGWHRRAFGAGPEA